MTDSLSLLALASAVLVAVERQLRTGTWPAWLRVPVWARVLIVVLLGVVVSAVTAQPGTWAAFGAACVAGLVAAAPALVALALHPEAAQLPDRLP